MDVEFNIPNSGTYVIVQNNAVVAGIEVVDSLQNANLEEIRKKYIDE